MAKIAHIILLCTMIGNRVSSQCNGTAQVVPVGYTTASITSPGYPSPGYGPNLTCEWIVDSVVGAKILFRVTDMTVSCTGDALNIYDGISRDGSQILTNECSPGGMAKALDYDISQTGSLFVAFTSDSEKTAKEHGFTLQMISAQDFSGTGCIAEQHLTATTTPQYLSSPNFPDKYDSFLLCTWHIETEYDSSAVLIQIEYFETEFITIEMGDYLEIKDNDTKIARLMGRDYIWFPSKNYTSSGNNITVRFRTDPDTEYRGFLLSYRQIVNQITSEETTTPLTTDSVTATQPTTSTIATTEGTTTPIQTESVTETKSTTGPETSLRSTTRAFKRSCKHNNY